MINPSAPTRITIIGGGMTGLTASHYLQHPTRGLTMPPHSITVFEGRSAANEGGKCAPNNLGAQFLDAEGFEPLTGPQGLMEHLGLSAGPARDDYDACAFQGAHKSGVSAQRYLESVAEVRVFAYQLLRTQPWSVLDSEDSVQIPMQLWMDHQLTAAEFEAMAYHFAIEEGLWNQRSRTTGISLLAGALNLAKGQTPMARHEVLGGFQQFAIKERQRLLSSGGVHQWLFDTKVTGIQQNRFEDLEVQFTTADGQQHTQNFHHVILALAPEHYHGLTIDGSQLPVDQLRHLAPAHIKKTIVEGSAPQELATPLMALWNNGQPLGGFASTATFFSDWESAQRLTDRRIATALGRMPQILFRRHWNNAEQTDGIIDAYTTLPAPYQAMGLLNLSLKQFFQGKYPSESLVVASQPLQMGCYTKDSALQGLMAALLVQQRMGLNTSPSLDSRWPLLEKLLVNSDWLRS